MTWLMLQISGLTLLILDSPGGVGRSEFGGDHVGARPAVVRHLVREEAVEGVNVGVVACVVP